MKTARVAVFFCLRGRRAAVAMHWRHARKAAGWLDVELNG
jgi:hypothetical protein